MVPVLVLVPGPYFHAISRDNTQARTPSAGIDNAASCNPPAAPKPNGDPLTHLRPNTVTSTTSGTEPRQQRVAWVVDAKKLQGTDRQAVSPEFILEVSPGERTGFKMVLEPKPVSTDRDSFFKARGWASVLVKREAELAGADARVNYRIGVGLNDAKTGPRSGFHPRKGRDGSYVLHDFAQYPVSRLPGEDSWNLNTVVDNASRTFVVWLEVQPAALEAWSTN